MVPTSGMRTSPAWPTLISISSTSRKLPTAWPNAGHAISTPPSGHRQAEDLQEVAEVRDPVVRRAIPVYLHSLIGVEHHGRQAGLTRSVDVAVHVVTDVQSVPGRNSHPVERELEEPPVGFAVPVVAGNDDRVEVTEQADLVQLAARINGLRIGDDRERIALPQDIEHLAHVRVQA